MTGFLLTAKQKLMLCINKRLYGACRAGNALEPQNALRSGRTLWAGNTLDALDALRTGRTDHAGRGIRRKRRRRRHGTGRRAAVTATMILKTVDDDHPPLLPCRIAPALHSMPRRGRCARGRLCTFCKRWRKFLQGRGRYANIIQYVIKFRR